MQDTLACSYKFRPKKNPPKTNGLNFPCPARPADGHLRVMRKQKEAEGDTDTQTDDDGLSNSPSAEAQKLVTAVAQDGLSAYLGYCVFVEGAKRVRKPSVHGAQSVHCPIAKLLLDCIWHFNSFWDRLEGN
uniref:Uncharacterized protein n=1 Tax=Steinernema glaseri TaxID=37863 RepID=A0A1I7YFI0_9BILA